MIKFREFTTLNEGGGAEAGHYEVVDLSLAKAKSIATAILSSNKKTLESVYSNFDSNFKLLKTKLERSLGAKRKDMPVISSWQVDDFYKHLKSENIKAEFTRLPVSDMKPIQRQIYFDKLVNTEIEFGGMKHGSDQTNKTIIMSREGHIIDGHHRWATAVLQDPTIEIKTLKVNMDIHSLLRYAMQYGISIGNKPNA